MVCFLCFIDWIRPVLGDSTAASCKYCSVTVKAHVKSLKAHMESVKHQNLVKSVSATTSITEILAPKIPD